MAKIVVALYDDFENAEHAFNALLDAGLTREDISLVAGNAKVREGNAAISPDKLTAMDEGETAGGAKTGAVVGGLSALLTALIVPEIGPILAVGPLLAALSGAGIGAIAGGLVGSLSELGIPEDRAILFAEGVRQGATLLTVVAPDPRSGVAVELMNRFDPVDMNSRFESLARAQGEMDDMGIQPSAHLAANEEADSGLAVEDASVQSNAISEVESQPGGEEAQPDAGLAKAIKRVPAGTENSTPISSFNETMSAGSSKDLSEMHSFEEDEPIFRDRFQSTYSQMGYSYDEFRPAFSYGYGLARDPRFQNKEWSQFEREARLEWELSHPNAPWKAFRNAIYDAWVASTEYR